MYQPSSSGHGFGGYHIHINQAGNSTPQGWDHCGHRPQQQQQQHQQERPQQQQYVRYRQQMQPQPQQQQQQQQLQLSLQLQPQQHSHHTNHLAHTQRLASDHGHYQNNEFSQLQGAASEIDLDSIHSLVKDSNDRPWPGSSNQPLHTTSDDPLAARNLVTVPLFSTWGTARPSKPSSHKHSIDSGYASQHAIAGPHEHVGALQYGDNFGNAAVVSKFSHTPPPPCNTDCLEAEIARGEAGSSAPIVRSRSSAQQSTVSDGSRRAVGGTSGRRKHVILPCSECGKSLKNRSDERKHRQTHEKPFVCDVVGCTRVEGFATPNDRERHRKAVHKVDPLVGPNTSYRCTECIRAEEEQEDRYGAGGPHLSGNHNKSSKIWPRKDNFKAHVKRKHVDENLSKEEEKALISAIMAASQIKDRPVDAMTSNSTELDVDGDVDVDASQVDFAADDHGYPMPTNYNMHTNLGLPEAPHSTEAALSGIQVLDYRLPNATALHNHHTGVGVAGDHLMSGSPFLTPPLYGATTIQGQDAIHPAQSTLMLPPRQAAKKARLGLPQDGAPHPYGDDEQGRMHAKRETPTKGSNFDITRGVRRQQHSAAVPLIKKSSNEEDKTAVAAITDASQKLSSFSGAATATSLQQRLQLQQQEGEHPCPYKDCNKSKKRECDLKKHIKRHTKPYGCTFPRCDKRFGSRNDWKRHENSQHYLQQMFKCGRDSRESGAPCTHPPISCEKQFRRHLRGPHHRITDPSELGKLCQRYRLGRDGNNSFWCGFCRKVLPQAPGTLCAWQVRMDHIGTHFDKQCDIDDWVCPEQNETKRWIAEHGYKTFVDEDDEYDDDDDEALHPEDSKHGNMSSSAGFSQQLPPLSPGMLGSPPLDSYSSLSFLLDTPLDAVQADFPIGSPFDSIDV